MEIPVISRLRRVAVLGLCVTTTIAMAEPGHQLWKYRMPITFGGYTGATTLHALPVLIELSAARSGFSYSQFAAPADGADLRFLSASGQELPYEVDGWDPTGTSRVWVQVPALTAATTIQALWGRSGVAAPTYRSDGTVWTNGYLAVWHFGEAAGAGTVADSAGSHDGTPVGNTALAATGRIGRGVGFDGTGDWIDLTGLNALPGKTSLTVSAWFFLDLLGTADANDSAAFATSLDSDAVLFWYNYSQTSPNPGYGNKLYTFNVGPTTTTTPANANRISSGANTAKATTWQCLTGVMAAKARRIYIDGTEKTSRTDAVAGTVGSTTTARIGSWSNAANMDFDGTLDELRISTVERSADWVRAEWLNVASNDVFCSYGTVRPYTISAVLIK